MRKSSIFIVLAVAAILLIPLVVMQFTNEVSWSLADFVIAGVLLLSVGFSYVLLARKVYSTKKRVAIAALLMVSLVVIWIQLAVGIVGAPINGS